MKKKLPIILLGVILACVLVFGFLYANNDIGKTANSLEADIRQSQKILDDWIVDGSISDTMAAFISYPQDKTDHTFSVYVNRPGLSFGYFFRGGGDIVEVDDYIAEFVVEGNNERAFISMNTQNIVRLEVDDGNGIQVIDIDSGKPFAIVLPLNVGNICFYDNRVSADLPDYIMNREIVRAALRTAKEADATDQEWQEFIDRITQRAKKSKEGGEIDA